MEKTLRESWIEDYSDYDHEEAIRRAARRAGVSVKKVRRILNARNEFYRALGLVTPGPIKGNPAREEYRRKCDTYFILREHSDIDVVFLELIFYIWNATLPDEGRILRTLIADAYYMLKCTKFGPLCDFIKWADSELESLQMLLRLVRHTHVSQSDNDETGTVY